MPSSRPDANLSALHASTGLPGHVLDVIVLTADMGLLATVQEASGPEHAIWHAASADTAVDLLVGGRCGILIGDMGTLRGDAASLLDRLHSQFPELILIATGRRDEEHAVQSLVGNGRIYRFLHKPISPARAALFITSATRRYNELRSVEPVALTTVRTMAARPNFGSFIAVIIAIVAAVAVFFIWLSRDQLAPLQGTQPSEPATQEQISAQLARAQEALSAGRLVGPRGDSAIEYFRAVLALQPTNADARAGIDRIVEGLEARVMEALQARNAPQGAIALTALQRAKPDHPRLDALSAQLVAISRSARTQPPASAATAPTAQAKPAADKPRTVTQQKLRATAPERAEPSTTVSEPQPAPPDAPSPEELATVTSLRERGALIEPAGNNAYDKLIALRERYPDSDEIRTEQQRLVFALLERTRTALAAGDVDLATALVTRADTLVPGMSTTKALQQQLSAFTAQNDFMKNVVQAATLKRVREAPVVYPKDAQRDGVEGWVDVEFTIAPDGTTRDLVVRGAKPADVFDEAAVDSVRKWRFAPIVKNGQAVPQRAVLRVQFVLRD